VFRSLAALRPASFVGEPFVFSSPDADETATEQQQQQKQQPHSTHTEEARRTQQAKCASHEQLCASRVQLPSFPWERRPLLAVAVLLRSVSFLPHGLRRTQHGASQCRRIDGSEPHSADTARTGGVPVRDLPVVATEAFPRCCRRCAAVVSTCRPRRTVSVRRAGSSQSLPHRHVDLAGDRATGRGVR
jgi:hypothetical protein